MISKASSVYLFIVCGKGLRDHVKWNWRIANGATVLVCLSKDAYRTERHVGGQ